MARKVITLMPSHVSPRAWEASPEAFVIATWARTDEHHVVMRNEMAARDKFRDIRSSRDCMKLVAMRKMGQQMGD